MARSRRGNRAPKPPKAPNPWDVPPFPASGDKTEDTVFLSVGKALSHWERFEIELAGIFAALIGAGKDSYAARRAYGSVVSFKGRIEMMESAAEVYFGTFPAAPIESNLAKLLKLAAQYSARRNEIAHGIVRPYFEYGSVVLHAGGYCLFPSAYNTSKSELYGKPKYIYTSREITYFGERFLELVPLVQGVAVPIVDRHIASRRKS